MRRACASNRAQGFETVLLATPISLGTGCTPIEAVSRSINICSKSRVMCYVARMLFKIRFCQLHIFKRPVEAGPQPEGGQVLPQNFQNYV